LSALLTPLSVVVAVYSFKLTCLALHLFNSYLVWQELKSTKSSSWYRSWMTLAYLLNPILLFEQVCNAHLDVILCTVLILLIRFFRRRQSVRGFLTLWVGIFAKALPIIWLPLTVVFLLRSRQWKSLAIALFVCVVTVIGFSQILLVTPQAWLSLLNPGVSGKTAGSVHNLLNAFLMGIQSILPSIIAHRPGRVVRAFSLLTYLLYCVYYARLMLRVYFRKHYTADRLFLDLGWATLALFLLATPWYQPWYASVLLPFVILLPRGKNLAGIAIVYATTSSIAYYGLAYGPYDVPLAIVSLLTVGPPLALSTFQSRSQVLVD
jgi:alpha-1,6-mannosyltransferase